MKLSLMWDREGNAPEGWLRHIPVQWGDIEGARGQYGFRRVEEWLNKSGAPAFLAFQFATANIGRNELWDLTPLFHKRSLGLTTAGGLRGQVPNYADRGWRAALYGAVEALAKEYRDDPRVRAFFWGPGVNDEINAVVNWSGADWFPSLRSQLSAEDYYSFVIESTERAVRAWAPKRVYLAGAPAPGTPWGARRKDITQAALAKGAGYRCNGLHTDFGNAMGLGKHTGTGMYEMCAGAEFCAFEGGLDGGGQPAMRLYWMLLQAHRWGAEHVNLQRSWIPAAEQVMGLLPTADAWIVFRDREYPALMWGEYGQSGVPGAFGCELELEPGAIVQFREDSFGFDRWKLIALRPFGLKTTLTPGEYQVTIWRPDGRREECPASVADGRLTLPAGEYHRVDVKGANVPQPLTLEERVARLERLHGLDQYA